MPSRYDKLEQEKDRLEQDVLYFTNVTFETAWECGLAGEVYRTVRDRWVLKREILRDNHEGICRSA